MAAPHLLHVFATFAPGGPQVRSARLFAAAGDSLRHSVVAMDARTTAAALVPEGVPLELLPAPPPGGPLRTLSRLRALMERTAPDAVLTYNWGSIEAALAARSLGLPLLHHEDGFGPDEARSFKRRRVLARRLVLRGARAVCVPSRTLERVALERWRLDPERVRHVPNGIESADFPARDGNPELRSRLGVPPHAPLVGSVGHLRAEKNFARLLEAFARLDPGAHLLLVGDGEERARLQERAQRDDLRGRVHLVGHQEELAPWYRALDVFALSSDTEQMPVALLEAMSAALPVVATDVGDVRDTLPPRARELVVPLGEDAAEGLAAGLAELCSDPERRATLGQAGRERARERFSFAAMLAAHRALWDEVLGREQA